MILILIVVLFQIKTLRCRWRMANGQNEKGLDVYSESLCESYNCFARRTPAGNASTCWRQFNRKPVMRRLQLRFDLDSTPVRLRTLRSQWRNTPVPDDPLAAVTLTYLFVSANGCNVGHWLAAARSNCSRMRVERRSNRSRIMVVITA